MNKITIIDFAAGNILSVQRAFTSIGFETEVTREPQKIESAQKLVLPGVGAFPKGIENINRLGLLKPLMSSVSNDIPLLGICLGFQLLFSRSQEFQVTDGLNLIEGQVLHLQKKCSKHGMLKVPHIGWNTLEKTHEDTSLFKDGEYMYFQHSFYVRPKTSSIITAYVRYGGHKICSAIQKGNITGCQFHPEKSGTAGLSFLGLWASA